MRWIAGIGLLLALVVAMSWREHRQTTDFCASVYAGMPIGELERLFERAGYGRWWQHQYADEAHPDIKQVFVPDPATGGEKVCRIKHDGGKVVSALYGN